jgi:hypothetical protein
MSDWNLLQTVAESATARPREERDGMRARFAYFGLGLTRRARAGKFLLISRAGTPAMATPFASAAAGIVNRCRSLLTPCVWPPGERRREPAVPGRGRMLARFVYFAPGRTRLAGACKSLLISFAGTPATAAPLAQPGAAGIVNRCRSLQIQPRERRREPAVPRRARAGERGRDAAVASLRGDCRRRRPPR